MEQHFLIILSGILLVTILDALGAIASRKFNFNYSSLSLLSFAIYLFIGYWAGAKLGTMAGITLSGIVALYDAIIGWKLSIWLKPNLGMYEELLKEEIEKMELPFTLVIIMTLFGMSIGWVGTLFT